MVFGRVQAARCLLAAALVRASAVSGAGLLLRPVLVVVVVVVVAVAAVVAVALCPSTR